MQTIEFSTLTLLNIAAVVEEAFPGQFEDRYFDLDRLQNVLNDDKIFSAQELKIIYLFFERNFTFDEIVDFENISIEIVRYTIDLMQQKLFCFSKVYRSKEYILTNDVAAYKLLKEGDTYLHLFGSKTYHEVAEEFVHNDFRFKLEISRAHAVIIALTLGFRGRELDRRYLNMITRDAKEKYTLYTLNFSDLEKYKDYDSVIRGQVDLRSLQEYLDRVVGHNVKILQATGLQKGNNLMNIIEFRESIMTLFQKLINNYDLSEGFELRLEESVYEQNGIEFSLPTKVKLVGFDQTLEEIDLTKNSDIAIIKSRLTLAVKRIDFYKWIYNFARSNGYGISFDRKIVHLYVEDQKEIEIRYIGHEFYEVLGRYILSPNATATAYKIDSLLRFRLFDMTPSNASVKAAIETIIIDAKTLDNLEKAIKDARRHLDYASERTLKMELVQTLNR